GSWSARSRQREPGRSARAGPAPVQGPARRHGVDDDQPPVAVVAISFRAAPPAGGTAFCWPGSQDSQRGRYQLRSPSRDIAAGMSTPRTTVASMSTAAAIATPDILNSISDSVAQMEDTPTMVTAPLVT